MGVAATLPELSEWTFTFYLPMVFIILSDKMKIFLYWLIRIQILNVSVWQIFTSTSSMFAAMNWKVK